MGFRQVCSAVVVVSMLTLTTGASAQSPSGMTAAAPVPAAALPQAAAAIKPELPRYLIYFNEFSAYLSPRAKENIAKAAREAKAAGVKSITVMARASATGTPQTNKYLAMTRASMGRRGPFPSAVSPWTAGP